MSEISSFRKKTLEAAIVHISRAAIVVRSEFASRVASYSLVTKRVSREVPLSRRGGCALDGSTIQQGEGIEVRAVHPSAHVVGGQSFSSCERRVCVSRGPDQHPLGGDTSGVARGRLPQGSIAWAMVNG